MSCLLKQGSFKVWQASWLTFCLRKYPWISAIWSSPIEGWASFWGQRGFPWIYSPIVTSLRFFAGIGTLFLHPWTCWRLALNSTSCDSCPSPIWASWLSWPFRRTFCNRSSSPQTCQPLPPESERTWGWMRPSKSAGPSSPGTTHCRRAHRQQYYCHRRLRSFCRGFARVLRSLPSKGKSAQEAAQCFEFVSFWWHLAFEIYLNL